MDYWRAACICLLPFLFILLVCFPLSRPLPPSPPCHRLTPSLIFNTLSLCPHSISRPRLPPPSPPSPPPPLFSPPFCLPREKRFCLLLVSAPSQSAFLISSYCFCLIFKCYPGPNGNPYAQKERERESGEREEGRRERNPAGYCVSLQDPETKPPTPAPPTP